MLAIRTCTSQEVLWWKAFGGAEHDDLYSCIECSDGGYALVGSSESWSEYEDLFLVKVDSCGGFVRSAVIGGESFDYGSSIIQMPDQGYLIAGTTYSSGSGSGDGWLVRTDSNFEVVWERTLGNNDENWIDCMISCTNGGYCATGATGIWPENMNIWVVRLNDQFEILWEREYDGGSGNDRGFHVTEMDDGSLVIAGRKAEGDSYDGWLIKTDSLGNLQWELVLGDNGSDRFNCVCQSSDGSILAVGECFPVTSMYDDLWVIKVTLEGDLLWDRKLGSTDGWDGGNWIVSGSDGAAIITGSSSPSSGSPTDLWLLALDTSGGLSWEYLFGGTSEEHGECLITTQDNSLLVGGTTMSYGSGLMDYLLAKFICPQGVVPDFSYQPLQDIRLSIYPNPACDYLKVCSPLKESSLILLQI